MFKINVLVYSSQQNKPYTNPTHVHVQIIACVHVQIIALMKRHYYCSASTLPLTLHLSAQDNLYFKYGAKVWCSVISVYININSGRRTHRESSNPVNLYDIELINLL